MGGTDLRFCSPQLDTSLRCKAIEYRASVSRDVPVYSPAFAGTKLYCLVTEAHRFDENNNNNNKIYGFRITSSGINIFRLIESFTNSCDASCKLFITETYKLPRNVRK